MTKLHRQTTTYVTSGAVVASLHTSFARITDISEAVAGLVVQFMQHACRRVFRTTQ